jgi:hypothetical protein
MSTHPEPSTSNTDIPKGPGPFWSHAQARQESFAGHSFLGRKEPFYPAKAVHDFKFISPPF